MEDHGGWIIRFEPGLHLARDILVRTYPVGCVRGFQQCQQRHFSSYRPTERAKSFTGQRFKVYPLGHATKRIVSALRALRRSGS